MIQVEDIAVVVCFAVCEGVLAGDGASFVVEDVLALAGVGER